MNSPHRGRLSEVALLFLKLGTTALGGPAVHIAMMEEEVVRRRAWVSREEFLDMLGVTNLIPGPNSTEMAIHVGYHRAGRLGLIVAGVCFILPAMLIVALIAAQYCHYGRLPVAQSLLYGVKPVVFAVVLQALWSLAKSAVKSKTLAGIGAVATICALLGLDELLLLAIGAIAALCAGISDIRKRRAASVATACTLSLPDIGGKTAFAASAATVATGTVASAVSLSALFMVFLKIGSVLFGSGYVLLAFLRTDLVLKLHWLTEAQLLDAVAVGQITPGPLFTTATFVGYLIAGPLGALVATVGIFLPAFVFVAATAPFLPRLRRSAIASILLDGLNVTSLALMTALTLQLAHSSIRDPLCASMSITAFVLLARWKVNSAWLIIGGGVIGILARMVQ